ncbi:hypothetical protein HWV62_10925 [Athelia sp. TMB]|nr:hypothetical protein HWV62_10925 [Athelia sp. TMB]
MSSSSLPSYNPEPSFQYTQTPNPEWKFGEKIESTIQGRAWLEGEKAGWKHVDTSTEDPAGIVPRPIAFVSTVSEEGVENLAPFSWFNTVTSNPPTISISIVNGPERVKDSTHNIKLGHGFTVNMISEPWAEQSNAASINAPPGVSEWPITGLTKEPSIHVKPPRVKESAFSMECELLQTVDIIHPTTLIATTTLVIAHVKHIHIRNDVLNERGLVDPAKFRPLARMGDVTYGTIRDGFRIPRFNWEDEKDKVALL